MPSVFLKPLFAHVDRLYRQHPTDPALCECRFTQRLTSCDAGAADGLLAKLLIQNPRSPSPTAPQPSPPSPPPHVVALQPAVVTLLCVLHSSCSHLTTKMSSSLRTEQNKLFFFHYFKRTNAIILRSLFPLPLPVPSFDWHLYQGHSSPTLSWIRTCAFNVIHRKKE